MPTRRPYAPLGLGLGIALLLAGCAGGATPNAAATTPAAAASGAPTPAGTQDPSRGGVSGTIAYVSGQLMQVQDTSMQTAVTWTGTTTISKEAAGTLADVVTGTCVVATSFTVGTGTSAAAPTAEPTVDPNAPASRVIVTEPVSGKCTGVSGFGGGTFGGRTPGQMPTGMPTGMPTDLPSGMPTGGFGGGGTVRAFGGVHNGLVTAVSGDTVTVESTAQNGTTSTSTFTVDAKTTYTTTVKADASAIVVGQCAAAFGPSDSSGKVTATSITVSAPTNGQCSSFGTGRAGGFGGQGRNRGGNGGSTSTQGGSNA